MATHEILRVRGISSLVGKLLPGIAIRMRELMQNGHLEEAKALADSPIVQLALFVRLKDTMLRPQQRLFSGGSADDDVEAVARFADAVTSPELLKNIKFEEMTAVQAAGYGTLSKGMNAIVKAPTGNGKTLSFLIPTLDRLISSNSNSWMLIMSPTRILMHQIAEHCNALVAGMNEVAVITTETPGERARISALSSSFPSSGPRIVVVITSVGRLTKMVEEKMFKMSDKVQTVVLDEADELLEDGFWKPVRRIFSHMPSPENRQTVFVSATLKENTVDRVSELMGSNVPYETIDVSGSAGTGSSILAKIKQTRMVVEPRELGDAIVASVCDPSIYAVVFVPAKSLALFVSSFLRSRGISGAFAVIGGMPENQRDNAIRSFSKRDGRVRVLVATDVIGRGFDTVVDLVVQVSLPSTMEHYTHRIGRTGRVSEGVSLSIIGSDEEAAYLSQKKLALWDESVVELRTFDPIEASKCQLVPGGEQQDSQMIRRAMAGYLGSISSNPVLKSVWKTDSTKYITSIKERFAGMGVPESTLDAFNVEAKMLKKMGLS